MLIIIRYICSFLSIGPDPITWPANNYLQIMVCSCVVPSKRFLLHIIFCSCVIETTFLSGKWQIASLSCQGVIKIRKQTWWSNDKTIIELGYRKISWFVNVSQIIICLSLRLRQIIDLLATDKSRYFAQPRPIIVNYLRCFSYYPVQCMVQAAIIFC